MLLLGLLIIILFIVLGATVAEALFWGILIGAFVLVWDLALSGRRRL